MKKRIYVPRKVGSPQAYGKQRSSVEKIELKEIFQTRKIDVSKLAFCVNICYNLADLMETLVLDAEAELKKAGPDLGLEMRHPIERMKIHTREMVRFVDSKTSEKFAESYGKTSDRLKELIINFYKKTTLE